ncbi:MAG: hypothetical protein ABI699_04180 [Caldimonas sp.]
MNASLPDHLRRVVFATATLCLLAACGGSDGPPAVDRVELSIGAAGGTLAHGSGANVTVGAGALAAGTTLAIETVAGASAPALPAGAVPVGATFAVTPHGQGFAQPVTLSIPFDPSRVPAGVRVSLLKTSNGASGPWVEVAGATVNGNLISGQVTAFSLTLSVLLPQITRAPQSQTVTEGQSASFDVQAFGFNPPFTYQWRRSDDGGMNFTDLSGETAPTLSVANARPAGAAQSGDNGAQFEVLVGSVRSAAATLTVTPLVPTTAALSVSVVGSGSVASVPVGIACGADCSEAYPLNTVVALTATPAAGFVFSAWSGDADCSDGNLTMSAARSCIATFTASAPAISAARIGAGDFFSVAVDAAGVPLAWGLGSVLGNGSTADRPTAAPLGTLNAVRAVAAGSIAALAVRSDGTLWAWGYRGSIDCVFGGTAPTPYQIMGAANVASMSMGSSHTLLLGSDGIVRAFGCNDAGQLGRAGFTPAATPVPVAGLPAVITAVAAGGAFSLALDGNRNVWAWGRGALGDGTALATPRFAPTQVPGLSDVVAIVAGVDHALALRGDGSVWAWGSNSNGKLGDGSELTRLTPVATLLGAQITAIAAGDQNSIALRADGIVLSWGINETGQLGSGSSSPGYRPQPAPVVGLTGVAAIDFGGGLGHSMAVRRDGTVWSWGYNNAGQLGNGTLGASSSTPVQVTGLVLN